LLKVREGSPVRGTWAAQAALDLTGAKFALEWSGSKLSQGGLG